MSSSFEDRVASLYQEARQEIAKVIIGQDEPIEQVLVCLLAGGHALIDDIRHSQEYAATFAASGCPDVRRIDSRAVALFTTIITMGSLRPATLLVRKSA